MRRIYCIALTVLFSFSVVIALTNHQADDYLRAVSEAGKPLGKITATVITLDVLTNTKTNTPTATLPPEQTVRVALPNASGVRVELSGILHKTDNNQHSIRWQEVLTTAHGKTATSPVNQVEVTSLVSLDDKPTHAGQPVWLQGDTRMLIAVINDTLRKTVQAQSSTQATALQAQGNGQQQGNAQATGEQQPTQGNTAMNTQVKEIPAGDVTYSRFCSLRFDLTQKKGYYRYATLTVPKGETEQYRNQILSFTNSKDETGCRDYDGGDPNYQPFPLSIASGFPCEVKVRTAENRIDRGYRYTFDDGVQAVSAQGNASHIGYCRYDQTDSITTDDSGKERYFPLTQDYNDCPPYHDYTKGKTFHRFSIVYTDENNSRVVLHDCIVGKEAS